MGRPVSGFSAFISELTRRRVFRVAVAYAVAAWIITEVGATVSPLLGLPEWTPTLVLVLVLLGFPVALVLAWAFELTPEGVRREGSPEAVMVAGASGVAVGAATVAGTEASAAEDEEERSEPPPRSVAVLPFVNLSADPENEYFSDGITEDIIAALSRIRKVKVISRTSVMQYKDTQRTVVEIGRELNVAVVVEGSVRRAGGRVRILAQAIDARTDEHLWAETYDRELEDIFEVQSDVADRIAGAMRAELTADERERHERQRTSDPEAYDLYLRARYLWNHRTEDGLRKSLTFYERAIEQDPGFALAYVGLADSYITLALYGAVAPRHAMPKAKAAAARALDVDDAMAEALTSRACVRSLFDWEWDAGEHDFLRAIDASPGYATAHHWYAMNNLAPRGRFEAARRELDRAAELEPLSPAIMISRGVLDFFERRYDVALARYSDVRRLHPQFGVVDYFAGQCHAAYGDYDHALEALNRALDAPGGTTEPLAALAHAYAVGDREDDARQALERLYRRRERTYVSSTALAWVHIGLRDFDDALDLLERAAEERATDLVWIAVRPAFDPLRYESRFHAIVQRIGIG